MYKYRAVANELVNYDSVTLAIDLGFDVIRIETAKLAGIDTSEFKDLKNKEKAEAFKKKFDESVIGNEISIKSLKAEKSGKYLVFIYIDGHEKSFNDELIEAGLVKAYEKKTR